MKRYSSSLIIREVYIQTMMTYHFTLSRMFIIKKRIANTDENVEKFEYLQNIGGNVNGCNLFWKTGSSSKNRELLFDP